MRHYITNLILATTICLANISCSDSDDNSTQNQQKQELAIDNDSIRYIETVSLMFDYDSTSVSYQPKYGEVLESVSPTVYSIGLKSENEARRWFLEHCVRAEEVDSIESLKQDNMTLNFGKYGEVKYEKSSQSSSYATIYLNLPGMKSQTQINLIPMELWPHNASSPFYVGDIVRSKKDEECYICVRACEGGLKGLLIGFNYFYYPDRNYINYYSFIQEWFKLPRGASQDAWNGLAQYYYSAPDQFKAYMKIVAQKVSRSRILYSPAMDRLVNDKDGDNQWPYPTEPQGSKPLGLYWNLSENMVYVGKNTIVIQDGMPRFKSKNVKMAWAEWLGTVGRVETVDFSEGSHSEEFTAEKITYENYVKVFGPEEMDN